MSIPETAAGSSFVVEDGVLKKYTGAGGDAVIPEGVTEIGKYAFAGCKSLTDITIPESITKIGKNAFGECGALTGIHFGGTREQWDALGVDSVNVTVHCADDAE